MIFNTFRIAPPVMSSLIVAGWAGILTRGSSSEEIKKAGAFFGVGGAQIIDVDELVTRPLLAQRSSGLFSVALPALQLQQATK